MLQKAVLIVVSQERSTPGRIGQMLVKRGYRLDVRRPRLGDPLPETLVEHAGAVLFGGPMSANDADPVSRGLIDWIGVPLREAAPLFGICLGAQQIARHLGAAVTQHPQGLVEIGYYPIHPTKAGAALMTWPDIVYQWHREGFELPHGATCLAGGDSFPNQAFRYGECAFAVQFHVELTLAMMYRWTTHGAHRMDMPGAQDRRAHLAGRAEHDAKTVAWLSEFLDLWLVDSIVPVAAR